MGFGLFSSILLLALFFRPLACQQPNTDGFLVSDFFKKMGAQGFNFSAPVCTWKGLFCEQDNVIKLVASGLGLSGLVPDTTIGKLKNLEYLDLSNNRITGLPCDFWSLSSLKTLNLSSNQISGNLSSNTANFGLLETLDLSSNNFSGNIPEAIGSLASLEVLKLNGNCFGWRIPLGILKCHSLVSIDLSSNQLNDSLPDGFGAAFPKLKYLNLAGNEIGGQASALAGMGSIRYLNISRNRLQGSVVALSQEPLEVIDLSGNRFEGHISQVLFNSSFNWSHLVYLDLSDNRLGGEISGYLNEAQNLKHLSLACNLFSAQAFPEIGMLSGLEYLNLSTTNLVHHIPAEISELINLRLLDVSKNHLSGQFPLLNMNSLQFLDVSYNNLSGEIPSSLLRELQWMKKFNFSYNNLTLCASEFSIQTLQMAFIGSLNSCPIAANPNLFRRKAPKHRGPKLALVLTISLPALILGLLFFTFGCRSKTRTRAGNQTSCKEQQNMFGPFTFQTDSTTWVADVKVAQSVPVVIFEKPLLSLTFADLLSATSYFDRDTLLAQGRFGPVYRGYLRGGIHVAVKVLVHGPTMTDPEAARGLEHLGRIRHPNLIPLIGYCLAGDVRIAIYDYMENDTLQTLLHDLPHAVQMVEDWSTDSWGEDDNDGIQNEGGFEGLLTAWRFRHKIALGTARALAFLHHGCSPPIIHRDIKATSIYIDSELEPRLCDFGLSKIFGNSLDDDDDEIAYGSAGYVPPEFLQPASDSPKNFTPKYDVYGFGVLLLELITGKKPVEDEYWDEEETTNLVGWVRGLVRKKQGWRAIDPKLRGTGSEAQMEEALMIGYLCTADLPSKRPSMHQVVGLLKDIEPAPL
ncbi:probable LRR receptor-like serine/threonine-protein kinase At2g24230 [Diospyros lotus]|uniref:probable LRR receptor-like serine/threonine-protein kinase At2g24230 n=1 Tax=Diospyros lotus TaxID=55363 RepID=UPI0022542902|nr:probable LRR receptor-like serine/threonine-protein kinase At2g24230 [Diospyros lotus]